MEQLIVCDGCDLAMGDTHQLCESRGRFACPGCGHEKFTARVEIFADVYMEIADIGMVGKAPTSAKK